MVEWQVVSRVEISLIDFDDAAAILVGADTGIGVERKVRPIRAGRLRDRPFGRVGVGSCRAKIDPAERVYGLDADAAAGKRLITVVRMRIVEGAVDEQRTEGVFKLRDVGDGLGLFGEILAAVDGDGAGGV